MWRDVHPVRALIAVVMVGGTLAMLLARINAPDAWWLALGAAIAFYFKGEG